jgi:Protein of unknown function (DUF1566)
MKRIYTLKAMSAAVPLLASLAAIPASLVIAAPGQAAPYVKVCNSGAQAGSGSCPASPVLGAGANDWACTIDQATNLMWEVKSQTGNRSYGKAFTSFDDPNQNQKSTGTKPTAAEVASAANVMGYINAINTMAPTLCGKTNWRRPTYGELNNLVLANSTPNTTKIDQTFFPWTGYGHPVLLPYTTSTNAVGSPIDKLYMVDFYTGLAVMYPRDHPSHVRLVTSPPVVATLPDCGANSTQVGQQCNGYLIEYDTAVYAGTQGHYLNKWSWSTVPATYSKIPRCTDPALGAQAKPCIHKYKWVKVTPINSSTQVTNPSSSVEVFPPN